MINKVFETIEKNNVLSSIKSRYLLDCEYCPVPPSAKYKQQLRNVLIGSWLVNLFCFLNANLGPGFMFGNRLWAFWMFVWFLNFIFLAGFHYKLFVVMFYPKILSLEIPRFAVTSTDRKSFIVGFLFIITHLLVGATLVFKFIYDWGMQNIKLF